jgi:hypothetical protein
MIETYLAADDCQSQCLCCNYVITVSDITRPSLRMIQKHATLLTQYESVSILVFNNRIPVVEIRPML